MTAAPALDKYGPKPPREIDQERFWNALECLPPCKWAGMGTLFESFHVSERLSGNVVSWYVRHGERYFEIDQDATLTREELRAMVAVYMKANPVPDTGETLETRYAVYRDNARAMGWSVKNYDEWLNS